MRSLVELVDEADADVFGGNETQRILDDLRKIPGHRVTVAGGGWDSDRGRVRSTSIVTRDSLTNRGEFAVHVADEISEVLKFAPDRALVCSMFEHPVADRADHRGVAWFELHAHATVRNRDPEHPVVREYVRSLHRTRAWMQAARRSGFLIGLTGDLQLPDSWGEAWGPEAQLVEPLNLRHRVVGIDWIMVDDALRFADPLEIHPLEDHRGFVADLVPA